MVMESKNTKPDVQKEQGFFFPPGMGSRFVEKNDVDRCTCDSCIY